MVSFLDGLNFTSALNVINISGSGLLDGMKFGDRFLTRSENQTLTAPKTWENFFTKPHDKPLIRDPTVKSGVTTTEISVQSVNGLNVEALNDILLRNRDEVIQTPIRIQVRTQCFLKSSSNLKIKRIIFFSPKRSHLYILKIISFLPFIYVYQFILHHNSQT